MAENGKGEEEMCSIDLNRSYEEQRILLGQRQEGNSEM